MSSTVRLRASGRSDCVWSRNAACRSPVPRRFCGTWSEPWTACCRFSSDGSRACCYPVSSSGLGDLAAGTMVIIEERRPRRWTLADSGAARAGSYRPSANADCRRVRTWRSVLSDYVRRRTGSAAACVKRWPSRWPGRSAIASACSEQPSRPTSFFVPFIIGSFWASDEKGNYESLYPCELKID